jgi:cystathionine beta-lyase/cystathionine gamma-synthase
VGRQNETTLTVARYLAGHPEVARVNYPGLGSHPAHTRARELFSGFGGMLSFELDGGGPAAARFISRIRLILHAGSLGGLETLVTRPVQISHVGMAPEEQARLGISSGLVRMSVGIEDPEDLIADLDQALGA